MTRIAAYIAAAIATAAVLVRGQTPPTATQTFRAGTDVVFVDVSVRDSGRPVQGLRAEDFILTDNGVRQRLDSVESEAVPIDLTLVLDLSGNSRGSATPPVSRAKTAARVRNEIAPIVTTLRPDDRLRLFAIDTRVQQLWPMQPVASLPALARIEEGGLASLYDTLAAALLQPVAPARRHVVVAATKGIDTISSIDAAAVRAIAERSDALLHLVALESASDSDLTLSLFQCSLLDSCWPTRRFWVPHRRHLFTGAMAHRLWPDGEILATGAAATGGALHQAELFTEPTLTGTFRKAFDDFRSGYVLRYTPQGVPREGWHAIQVTVPKSRSYVVRARNGYAIDDVRPPGSLPALPEVPKTLGELTEAYERQAFSHVTAGLRAASDPRRLLRDFEERGNPWPATPAMEAAFAVELTEPAVFSEDLDTREAAQAMLTRFTRFVRHPIEPHAFERYWYFAALTLLEGALRPAATEALADLALARFPTEPRFILSRAIAADQRWAMRARRAWTGRSDPSPPIDADAVRTRYEAALTHPSTAPEARIRFAWFLHGAGKQADALAKLTEAADQPIDEPGLRYLRLLFLGHVLSALDRHDEALAAFRAALEVLPAAQSGRVALMNALLMRGDRSAAEALAEQVQTAAEGPLDPWWVYWQGQYRFYSTAIARIREMSR